MTPAQRKAMRQAIADGGEITMTGIDRTAPCPKRLTVRNLVELGYLHYAAHPSLNVGFSDYLRVTEAGYEAME